MHNSTLSDSTPMVTMSVFGAGLAELEKCLTRKALVVIDDVDDDAGQLDMLLPRERDCLHPDSMFVVTSRNAGILKQRCGVVREVGLLGDGLDARLFSVHAFAAGKPMPAVDALVSEVVAACCGLPLTLMVQTPALRGLPQALYMHAVHNYCCLPCSYLSACMTAARRLLPAFSEFMPCPRCHAAIQSSSTSADFHASMMPLWAWQVMGRHLRCYSEQPEMWQSALEKLRCALSVGPGRNDQLFARLQISYDSLPKSQQDMFLDTACYFIGQRAETAKHAWRRFASQIAVSAGVGEPHNSARIYNFCKDICALCTQARVAMYRRGSQ